MQEAAIEPTQTDEALLREGIASFTLRDDPEHRARLGAQLTAMLERDAGPSDESLPAWLARDLAVAWLRLGRWADTVGGAGELLASFDVSGVVSPDGQRGDVTRHRRVFDAVISRLGIAAADVATILAKHHAVEARLLRRRRLIDALRAPLDVRDGRLTSEGVAALLALLLPGVPDVEGVHAAVTRTSVVLIAPTATSRQLARWFPAQRTCYDPRDAAPEQVDRLAAEAGFERDEVLALLSDCVRVTVDDDLDAALSRETFGRLGAGDLVRAMRWRDARRGCFIPVTLSGLIDRSPDSPRLLDTVYVDRDGALHVDAAALDERLGRWARARVEGEVPSILAELAAESIARHARLFRSAADDAAPPLGADVFARTLRLLRPLLDDFRPLLDELASPRALDRLAAESAWVLPLRERARLPEGISPTALLALREDLAPIAAASERVRGDWLSLSGAIGEDGAPNALGALWRVLVRVQCRIDALTDGRLGRTPTQSSAGRDLALMLFLIARQAERGRSVSDMDDFLARYAARVLDLVASIERAHGFSEGERHAPDP